MRRGRAGALAIAIVAAWVAVAMAQVGPDAGVPDDAGAAGDAGPPRIVIDGPTLLGIGKPQVSAAASPTELRLGDKITLFVEVIFDESVAVALPAGLDLAPAFDELKRSSVDERRSDGTRKRVYQIQLQVWELGEFDLPPVQVTYSIGGESSWVVTNRVPLRVVGSIDAIDDPNALLGATPPVPIKRRDWRWIAALIIAGALVVGALAWWLGRRWLARRRRRIAEAPSPTAEAELAPVGDAAPTLATAAAPSARPAEAAPRKLAVAFVRPPRLGDAARRALDALDALAKAGTLVRDQPAGYVVMVGAVRTFLLERYDLPSRHRTTSELCAALGRTGVDPAGLAAAEAWLKAADVIKFGGAHDDDDGAAALAAARELIVRLDAGARR